MSRRLVPAAVLFLLPLVLVPALAGAQSLVALAVTPSGDGVLTLPVGGDAAFAVAAVNYAGPAVDARVFVYSDVGPLPVTVLLCRTNPATGACVDPGGLVRFEPGEVVTFSVFVHGLQAAGGNPATSRAKLERSARRAELPPRGSDIN